MPFSRTLRPLFGDHADNTPLSLSPIGHGHSVLEVQQTKILERRKQLSGIDGRRRSIGRRNS